MILGRFVGVMTREAFQPHIYAELRCSTFVFELTVPREADVKRFDRGSFEYIIVRDQSRDYVFVHEYPADVGANDILRPAEPHEIAEARALAEVKP
jgi:hypothetical protein